VHSRSFFLSSSFFFFSSVSHRSEKKEDLPSILYVLPAIALFLLRFFPHPIAATYTQTFSSRLPLLVGQAFLFVVSPTPSARSLARAATASSNIVDTSSFFFASRFFFC
jgi:hypothetical protein